MGLQEDVDHLYALLPDEFIAARDACAKYWRERDASAAEEIAGLRKPTVAAWALNQVARDAPGDITALIAAGARLQKAQQAALGGGGGEALRGATLERRGLAARVSAMAGETLAESGRDDSAYAAEITATLDAALHDPSVAEDLLAGHLATTHATGGFGFGEADVAVAKAAKPKAVAKKAAPKPVKSVSAERAATRADELTAQAVDARREFDELSEQADEAEDAAKAAEEAARAAKRTATELRRKADDLRKRTDRAEVKVGTLEQQAWAAMDTARKADRGKS